MQEDDDHPGGADGQPEGVPPRKARPGLSLKGRALKCLSMREHSRVELRRKLAPHAESPEQLDAVLDELESRRFLSAERFAESMVHRKAARFGAARIKAELSQHQLPPDVAEAVVRSLRDTEFERAHALWAKRHGELPSDPQAHARQARFLAARGFSGDVIRRVLKGEGPVESD
ncbi:MAG: recombination regulator RecX [Burkholderiales bacterium]|nr:recombination regulator RecX [Burkholderiales bacterium]MBH2016588.1 recombination regulator RecX [Burkholderiales bacterium]